MIKFIIVILVLININIIDCQSGTPIPVISSVEPQVVGGNTVYHIFGTFGSNNAQVKVTVYLGGKTEQEEAAAYLNLLILAKPSPLFLTVGVKTLIVEVEGDKSQPYIFISLPIIIGNPTINGTMITIRTASGCYNSIVQFANNNGSIVSIQNNNALITSTIPASARNGNVTLFCYDAPSSVLIKLTPTLNYSTSSNTSGTIITIYGRFITPLDYTNNPLPISIKTSNGSCTNITNVSLGVTTCIAPPGAGNSTTLSITIDGVTSTTIPLIYNNPSISNYTFDNGSNNIENTLYLSGYNFGDNNQPIFIKYNGVLYNATHTIPHKEVKVNLGNAANYTSASSGGNLQLIVDGQSSNSIDFLVYYPTPTPTIKEEGGGGDGIKSALKWILPLCITFLIVSIVVIIIVYRVIKNKNKPVFENNELRLDLQQQKELKQINGHSNINIGEYVTNFLQDRNNNKNNNNSNPNETSNP